MHSSVGARLLGLYFLVSGIASLPAAIASGFLAGNVFPGDAPATFFHATVLVSLAQALVFILAGLWLTFRKHGAQAASTTFEPSQVLRVGLQLLGVFFVVSGTSDMLWSALRASVRDEFLLADYGKTVAGAFEVAAGLVLWFRAGALSAASAR